MGDLHVWGGEVTHDEALAYIAELESQVRRVVSSMADADEYALAASEPNSIHESAWQRVAIAVGWVKEGVE